MEKKVDFKKLALCTALALCACMGSAGATGNLDSSTIGVGIKNMLSDGGSFLLLLSPIAGGAAAGYFIIRRGMADEQDGKMWSKRIVIAVVCAVGGMLVGSVIKLIGSYFGV